MAAHRYLPLPAGLRLHPAVKVSAVCEFGKHTPEIPTFIAHNICGKCGREIERMLPDGANGFQWWGTSEQVEAVIQEETAEHNAEYAAEMYAAMHPEDRCPPRE